MGEGDHIPGSSQRRKADPAYVKKIIAGGKKAKKIHEESLAEHQKNDVPEAIAQLDADLEELFKNQ